MSPIKRCHRLKSLSVAGGFLDGLEIDLADGLNCLIGPRGTGKTTVLEFIRYALDEFPGGDGQARKDVGALVASNLGDGRIRLAVETRDGLEYIVDRSVSGDPMVLTTDEYPSSKRALHWCCIRMSLTPQAFVVTTVTARRAARCQRECREFESHRPLRAEAQR